MWEPGSGFICTRPQDTRGVLMLVQVNLESGMSALRRLILSCAR